MSGRRARDPSPRSRRRALLQRGDERIRHHRPPDQIALHQVAAGVPAELGQHLHLGQRGLAAGVGRVGAIVGPFLGGALVTAGIAYPWGFYAFAVAALLAVGALATVPAHLRREEAVAA